MWYDFMQSVRPGSSCFRWYQKEVICSLVIRLYLEHAANILMGLCNYTYMWTCTLYTVMLMDKQRADERFTPTALPPNTSTEEKHLGFIRDAFLWLRQYHVTTAPIMYNTKDLYSYNNLLTFYCILCTSACLQCTINLVV